MNTANNCQVQFVPSPIDRINKCDFLNVLSKITLDRHCVEFKYGQVYAVKTDTGKNGCYIKMDFWLMPSMSRAISSTLNITFDYLYRDTSIIIIDVRG